MINYLPGNSSISYGMDSLSMRLFGLDTKSTDCQASTITPSSDTDASLSLLYTALPQILQSRMPKLRSLRSAASAYTIIKTRPRSRSPSTSSTTSTSSSSESPPPSYHTRPSTSADSDTDTDFNTAPSSRPSTSGSTTPAPVHFSPFATHDEDGAITSSIGNRSSHHGLALLNLALRSEQTATIPNDPIDRRFYIDGVSYILRGLPTDLSPEELIVLRTAAPAPLLPSAHHRCQTSETETDLAHHQPTTPPTLLHRLTSTLTFYTLLLATLLLPHLQKLLQTLFALEKQHNLSARFFSQTTLLLQLASAQALALAVTLWEAQDGALRLTCRNWGVWAVSLGIWVLRDVSGGMDEGVGRAVAGLRIENNGREAGK